MTPLHISLNCLFYFQLREMYPEITSVVPLSPLEKSGKNKGNDQSFCSISHDHANTEIHGCPSETDTIDAQKNPVEPIRDLNEPSTLYGRCYDQPQENTVGVFGVSV